MSERPSLQLLRWVESESKRLASGTQFPIDPQVAKTWSLSERTVKRVMKKCEEKGLVVRVPGKGTFVPPIPSGRPGDAQGEAVPPKHSVQAAVESLTCAIRSGELRKGDAFPSMKYMRLQYRLAPATVRRVFDTLVRRGYAHRIGKTYWVGPFEAKPQHARRKDVFLFNIESTDFTNVFVDTPYGRAYRKLEYELSSSGFNVLFASTSKLRELTQEWLGAGHPPHGIVFVNINAESFDVIQERLTPLREKLKSRRMPLPRILLDWRGPIAQVPRGYSIVHRGNILTAAARAIARYLATGGYRDVALYLGKAESTSEQSVVSFLPVHEALKIRTELENLDAERSLKLAVYADTHSARPELWLAEHLPGVSPENIRALVGKYRDTPLEEVAGGMVFVRGLSDFCEKFRGAALWMFAANETAADALAWAKKRGIPVPARLGVFSLESNPRYYHLGLSCCEVDWEGIGYLMAHAVMGDFAVEKTSRGFIRPVVRVVERQTT